MVKEEALPVHVHQSIRKMYSPDPHFQILTIYITVRNIKKNILHWISDLWLYTYLTTWCSSPVWLFLLYMKFINWRQILCKILLSWYKEDICTLRFYIIFLLFIVLGTSGHKLWITSQKYDYGCVCSQDCTTSITSSVLDNFVQRCSSKGLKKW